MSTEDLIETFRAQLRDDPDVASAVAAIRVLLGFLKQDRGETIQGLRSSLLAAIDTLSRVDSSVAVSSGGELFLRFISLTSLEYSDYSKCKEIMIERGEIFLRKVSLSRNKIAKLCHPFIRDGAVSRPRQRSSCSVALMLAVTQKQKGRGVTFPDIHNSIVRWWLLKKK